MRNTITRTKTRHKRRAVTERRAETLALWLRVAAYRQNRSRLP